MLACFAASVYGLFTAGAPGWDIAGVTALGAEMGAVSAWSVWASARGRHGQVGAASLVSGIVGCGMVLGPLQASLPLHSDSGSVLSACWFPLVWGVALAANGIRLYWKTYGRLGPA